MAELAGWENFYIIVGSSAAALTGLQFVVVALSSDARAFRDPEAVGAFGTPTIVHFCVVLLLGAIISTPGQTSISLSICLAITGIFGLGYLTLVMLQVRRQTTYAPVLEDWIWHSALPFVAYAFLFIAGIALCWHTVVPLYVVGASALLLLFIGIHNAWDAAVWISMSRKDS